MRQELKRHWVKYDENHSMDIHSGIIVNKGNEFNKPNPQDIKGIDRIK